MEKSSPNETFQSDIAADRTSPINALPSELFLDILVETIDDETLLIPQLHNLAQVCTYWFKSIMSNARFWRVIDLDTSDLAPLVIRRNPTGPLTVRCWVAPQNAPIVCPVAFLEVAREQAHRWESLEVGDLRKEHMRLFDISTPALESVYIVDNHQTGSVFPLPDAPRLKHVLVWGIQLHWDSPSLRGLKSISISYLNPTGPSLQNIISILPESPTLEWFAFKNVGSAAPLDEDHEQLGSIISLPHLQGLDLDSDVPPIVTSSLLRIIDAPRCRILEATVLFDAIQQLGLTFAALASVPLQAAKYIHVRYYQTNAYLRIGSTRSPSPDDLISTVGWRREGDEARIQFKVNKIPYSGGSLAAVFDTLALPWNQTEAALELFGDNGPDLVGLFNDHPALWNSATALSIQSYTVLKTTTTLRFLANPTVEDGHYRWPCPRSTRLRIDGDETMPAAEVASAVLEFLEKRSGTGTVSGQRSGRDTEFQVDIPVRLESIAAKQTVIVLIQGAKVANGIQLLGWFDDD